MTNRPPTPDSRPPIRVLIVEDSPVAREYLIHILSSDPSIRVVGTAFDGLEALEAVKQKKPDIITMDIHMPKMNGFDATRRIMETVPTPIVIVSASTGAKEVASTFRAMEAGALAVILRPPGIGSPEHEAAAEELIRTVKLMSEIKVVRRIPADTNRRTTGRPSVMPSPVPKKEIKAVAMGASTGGPVVFHKILSRLPKDLPFPVLIVQHIAPGFTNGFAEWLAGATNFPVRIASHREYPEPGHAYIAPDGFHIGVETGGRIVLSDHEPENGLRPSVAHLFRSVAKVLGPAAIGVLLTGMGKDGARELKAMRDEGAITIAQDEVSSVVNGMPGEAVKLGAARYVLTPEDIADFLVALVKR